MHLNQTRPKNGPATGAQESISSPRRPTRPRGVQTTQQCRRHGKTNTQKQFLRIGTKRGLFHHKHRRGKSVALVHVVVLRFPLFPKFAPTLCLFTNMSGFGSVSRRVHGLVGVAEFHFRHISSTSLPPYSYRALRRVFSRMPSDGTPSLAQ